MQAGYLADTMVPVQQSKEAIPSPMDDSASSRARQNNFFYLLEVALLYHSLFMSHFSRGSLTAVFLAEYTHYYLDILYGRIDNIASPAHPAREK